MKQLYLECSSGISGDMFTAALLDLGADEELLRKILCTVPAEGFQIKVDRVKKAGLDVCDFQVQLEEKYENHDHDMEYLFGKEEIHHHHTHTHVHRGMKEIAAILEQTQMPEKARNMALKIFTILGEAEAKAHGTTLEQVHFHEVGALDSIVDIISAAVCLYSLGVDDVIIPKLCEGTGSIRCQHGILPVPVPAVSNIIQRYGLPIHMTEMKGELITPTGAAIAAAIQTREKLPETFQILKVGMGGGKRAYEIPSILRAMLIEEQDSTEQDVICKLESNIDDCNGEVFGYVMDLLFQAGARDVNYMPVFMKKNRPAYQLNVICSKEDVAKMEEIIFRETTTIGIRRILMERSIVRREIKEVETSVGCAKVKICDLGEKTRIYPEYDSVVELSRKSHLPFMEIFRLIEEECREKLK